MSEDVEVITISISRRLDGGIRVWSDDLPGLVLSGSDPETVMSDVWPAIQVLLTWRER